MGRDAYIVAESTKYLLSLDLTEYDVNLPPLRWRDCQYVGRVERPLKQVLRIGWYDSLNIFPCTPGVKRAVAEAAKTLKVMLSFVNNSICLDN